jgi:hypothetical protein
MTGQQPRFQFGKFASAVFDLLSSIAPMGRPVKAPDVVTSQRVNWAVTVPSLIATRGSVD